MRASAAAWLRFVLGVLCLCTGQGVTAAEWRWFEADRPARQARQATDLLRAAASHGLEPQDYGADALQQALTRAADGPPRPASEIERIDQGLTAAMQRYLSDLHSGRVDPRQVHQHFSPPRRDDFDAAAYLQTALAAQRLPAAARDAAPRLPLYAQLQQALARYRLLAEHPAWQQALPPLPIQPGAKAGKLVAGQAYAGLALLTQRLAALGDLAPDVPVPARFEGPLVAALKVFQQRHGLTADGVIGQATIGSLQVAPAARVRQIELTLERLRWTPLLEGARMIVVNIPEFVLRAYEVRDGRILALQAMKVIVGRALDQRTPVFDADLRFIEFSPYWNVPPSIARAETVPRLRREPAYFEREGFEFVGPNGQVHSTLSTARLDAVLAGRLRIRQRPGPHNALGDIKFVFPNAEHIFLHHTPTPGLFTRDRRDLSHGCIRVEQPLALARFVLSEQPDWTEDRIRQAMSQGVSTTLRLAEPVRVLIAYGTTLVKDGRIYFLDDIYGHDRLLDAALRRRSAGP
jgi:L,D-transpeptidase YcbB